MILWLNGAFGAGKTQAAYELLRRTGRSVLCDPEEVGYGLHRMVPRGVRRAFQDLPAWRHGVRDQLAEVSLARPRRSAPGRRLQTLFNQLRVIRL